MFKWWRKRKKKGTAAAILSLKEQKAKDRREKEQKDREALERYRQQLRMEQKVYSKQFSAISEGGRKNRAIAIGECCLQGMEELTKLVNQRPPIPFVKGSLFWNLGEERVRDETGEKGYRYTVIYHVQSREAAWTEEEIEAKVKDAEERMRRETEEMYGRLSDSAVG